MRGKLCLPNPRRRNPSPSAGLRAASGPMLRLVMLPALATGLSTLNSIHIMRRGHIILCKWAAVCPDATETASLNEAPYPAARVFGQVLILAPSYSALDKGSRNQNPAVVYCYYGTHDWRILSSICAYRRALTRPDASFSVIIYSNDTTIRFAANVNVL